MNRLLTEMTIRQAKPALRGLKLFDGRGLFLLLQPSGSRYWRFKYRINGKEKLLALGVFPDVPLKLARERREEARRLVANGVDPSAKRQAEKISRSDTFEAIAREWLALRSRSLFVVPMMSANVFRAEPAEQRGRSGQGARGGIDGGNSESTDHLNKTT